MLLLSPNSQPLLTQSQHCWWKWLCDFLKGPQAVIIDSCCIIPRNDKPFHSVNLNCVQMVSCKVINCLQKIVFINLKCTRTRRVMWYKTNNTSLMQEPVGLERLLFSYPITKPKPQSTNVYWFCSNHPEFKRRIFGLLWPSSWGLWLVRSFSRLIQHNIDVLSAVPLLQFWVGTIYLVRLTVMRNGHSLKITKLWWWGDWGMQSMLAPS